MCGIVGFIGNEEAAPILLEGLSRLEYRGYDSAGIAVYGPEDGLKVVKAKGRLQVLSDIVSGGKTIHGTLGLGHTRWATHGEPSDINSHPHVSQDGRIAVVHNGIIENYVEIKEFLQSRGVHFASQTDTEVVAQLLEYYYSKGEHTPEALLDAVVKVLHRIDGGLRVGNPLRRLSGSADCRAQRQPSDFGLWEKLPFSGKRCDRCDQVYP